MTNTIEQKLKLLTRMRIPGTPLLSAYLAKSGISRNLQQYYARSGWLENVGHGAYIWPGDELDWQGVIHSLQAQLDMPVHVGARTALALAGYAHFLRAAGEDDIFLFSSRKRDLPMWISRTPCCKNFKLSYTSFLPGDALGLSDIPHKTFTLRVSCPERAMLETLYLTPKKVGYIEAYHLMENLTTLRPRILNELLSICGSVKVKRVFSLFADKAGHSWARYLDKNIGLGAGIRSLARNGVYIEDYHLIVPRELSNLWE
jgi:hypothetical protein